MKFDELLTYPNVYENFDAENPRLVSQGKEYQLKGNWAKSHFKNANPIVLELACGRGEYSLAMARLNPGKNFIGVDIKGARIWKGATIALAENLINVAFLRTRIEQIDLFFEQGEVDEIWITFPDPFLRNSKANRRLTSPNFLKRYEPLLAENGIIHLKTDEIQLFEYTLGVLNSQSVFEVVYQNEDIYSGPLYDDILDVKTHYEKQHLANEKTIKYIRFVRISKQTTL